MPEQLLNATAELLSGNRPRQFSKAVIEDFRRKPHNAEALDVVKSYLTEINLRLMEGRGLCLIGPPQEGKTLLATIVLNAAMQRFTEATKVEQMEMRRKFGTGGMQRPGFPVYFMTLSQYVRAHLRMFNLRAAWERVSDASAEFEEYKQWDTLLTSLRDRVELLVLDDIGKEHRTGSGFAEDEFDYLIRQRQHHQLPTIFTSNLELEKWDKQYHESVRPFVLRTCDIAIIGQPDQRRSGGRRNAQ